MQDLRRLVVLDVGFLSISVEKTLELFEQVISSGGKESVSFINADCINISYHDAGYRDILNNQSLVLPDGAGISIACRMIGERLVENLNGTDLLPHICQRAVEKGHSIFLLGAAEQVAARMKVNLERAWPGLNVCGEQHGYFDPDTELDAVIDKINAAQPNIVLVAFGAPRQEKWIHEHRDRINANLLLGVGGLFDFFSGDKKRAPLWMRERGLEWMYRLYLEPGRLWRRYIVGNPVFIYRMLRWTRKYKSQHKQRQT